MRSLTVVLTFVLALGINGEEDPDHYNQAYIAYGNCYGRCLQRRGITHKLPEPLEDCVNECEYLLASRPQRPGYIQ